MKNPGKLIFGLDLGSTKVAMSAVRFSPEAKHPEILGFSQKKCRFSHEGTIVNLEGLMSAVQDCMDELKTLTRGTASEVVVNIPPLHFHRETGHVTASLKKKQEIKHKHLYQLQENARLEESEDFVPVHTFVEGYQLDGQMGINSPIAMKGQILTANIHQIYVPRRIIDNILHCIKKCKLRVTHFAVDPIGTFQTLLTQDEMEMGVWVIDIGGAYTSMAALKNHQIKFFSFIKLGGDRITSDIAIGLRTSIREAEKLKIEHGSALPELAETQTELLVSQLGGSTVKKKVSPQILSEIIYPRIDEIMELASHAFLAELQGCEYPAGILLTGGSAVLPGMEQITEKHFNMPVVVGKLRNVSGLTDLAPDSLTSTAIGLALFGARYPQFNFPNPSRERSFFQMIKGLTMRWGGGLNT